MNGALAEGKSTESEETDRLETLPNGSTTHHVTKSQVIPFGPHARGVILLLSGILATSAISRSEGRCMSSDSMANFRAGDYGGRLVPRLTHGDFNVHGWGPMIHQENGLQSDTRTVLWRVSLE